MMGHRSDFDVLFSSHTEGSSNKNLAVPLLYILLMAVQLPKSVNSVVGDDATIT